jgi:hypothetical protein
MKLSFLHVHWLRAAVAAVSLCAVAAFAAPPALKTFDSPEAAMNAFGQAVLASDDAALKGLLGADFLAEIPPLGAGARQRFIDAWNKQHAIRPIGEQRVRITVGTDGWTFPAPLIKSEQGWRFDPEVGAEEIRERRIGRNELAAMQTLLAIWDAQREYASEYRDGDKLLKYASKLRSSPGKRDGLYWPTQPGEAPSPVGPALADAGAKATSPDGYNGYHYKLLVRQGPKAKGGSYNYLVQGKLIGGFAVLAWPARYWDTGVMSFIVNHDGVVYERDLGPDTEKKAAAMQSFDPGPEWTEVSP